MSKSLFKNFSPVSLKEWKQKIQVDLKGADYNETLIWKTNEGIDVKPVYHTDEYDELPSTSNTKATLFKICQTVYVSDAKNANLKAVEVLSKGAEGIKFIVTTKDISLEHLLSNIDLASTPIYFELLFLDSDFINQLNGINSKSRNLYQY